MTRHGLAHRGGDQSGLALPMAMIALVLLTALMIAFAVLARSEPMIANNHLRVAQARALAESGLERAIWALSNPGAVGGIASPMPGSPAPAPYDGTYVSLGAIGGFQVTVTSGPTINQRNVVTVGWTPTNDPADPSTKAHRRIQATVQRLPDLGLNAPCALCVKSSLQVGGNATIDSRADTSCGKKWGAFTSGDLCLGTNCQADSGAIYGALDTGGDLDLANQPTDYQQNQALTAFDSFTLSPRTLALLRTIAKKRNTYYGPGSPPAMGWSDGTVTFDTSNKVASGIVFVDNASATDITQANSATVPQATVNIHGSFSVDPSFQGWLIVNGTVSIDGATRLDGLLYALNDMRYAGGGTGEVRGLVITQNVRDSSPTWIDTSIGGSATVEFNCPNARGRGHVPQGWFVESGTHREVADP
jgi:hypothetical protein